MNNQPDKINVPAGKVAWCTCGLSKQFPRCDGSHQSTDKKPIVEIFEVPTDKYICKCLSSKNFPFCDGSHVIDSEIDEKKI